MRATVFIFLFFIASVSFAKNSCVRFLNVATLQNDTATITETFISYLSVLLEGQVLTQAELEEFAKVIKEEDLLPHPFGKVINTQMDRRIHEENIQNYINEAQKLNKDLILIWAKGILEKAERTKRSKSKTKQQTKSSFVEMKFIPVDFSKMNKPEGINLNRTVEVMQTLVTQKMWVDEMRRNPSYYQKGGDYPVETVSILSAMEFANRMSKKAGLEPFYDLSKLRLEGRAENGELTNSLQDDVAEIIKVIDQQHQRMDEADGYRLPSYDELYSLQYHSRDTFKNLDEEIWFEENANNMTHEVNIGPKGLLRPDGEFSDLSGNVSEWTSKLTIGEEEMTGPGHIFKSIQGTAIGGYFMSTRDECNKLPTYYHEDSRSYGIGLRLVRTIVKPKNVKK